MIIRFSELFLIMVKMHKIIWIILDFGDIERGKKII